MKKSRLRKPIASRKYFNWKIVTTALVVIVAVSSYLWYSSPVAPTINAVRTKSCAQDPGCVDLIVQSADRGIKITNAGTKTVNQVAEQVITESKRKPKQTEEDTELLKDANRLVTPSTIVTTTPVIEIPAAPIVTSPQVNPLVGTLEWCKQNPNSGVFGCSYEKKFVFTGDDDCGGSVAGYYCWKDAKDGIFKYYVVNLPDTQRERLKTLEAAKGKLGDYSGSESPEEKKKYLNSLGIYDTATINSLSKELTAKNTPPANDDGGAVVETPAQEAAKEAGALRKSFYDKCGGKTTAYACSKSECEKGLVSGSDTTKCVPIQGSPNKYGIVGKDFTGSISYNSGAAVGRPTSLNKDYYSLDECKKISLSPAEECKSFTTTSGAGSQTTYRIFAKDTDERRDFLEYTFVPTLAIPQNKDGKVDTFVVYEKDCKYPGAKKVSSSTFKCPPEPIIGTPNTPADNQLNIPSLTQDEKELLEDPAQPWSNSNPINIPIGEQCPEGSTSKINYKDNPDQKNTYDCFPSEIVNTPETELPTCNCDPGYKCSRGNACVYDPASPVNAKPKDGSLEAGVSCDGSGLNSSCKSNDCRKTTKPGDDKPGWYCLTGTNLHTTDILDVDGKVSKRYNGSVCKKASECASDYCGDNYILGSFWRGPSTCKDDPFRSNSNNESSIQTPLNLALNPAVPVAPAPAAVAELDTGPFNQPAVITPPIPAVQPAVIVPAAPPNVPGSVNTPLRGLSSVGTGNCVRYGGTYCDGKRMYDLYSWYRDNDGWWNKDGDLSPAEFTAMMLVIESGGNKGLLNAITTASSNQLWGKGNGYRPPTVPPKPIAKLAYSTLPEPTCNRLVCATTIYLKTANQKIHLLGRPITNL